MSDETYSKRALAERKAQANAIRQLQSQNALHGAFAAVWERLGGLDHLEAWAREEPSKFYQLMGKMSPSLVPTHGMQGEVKISVHHSLAPTELDSGSVNTIEGTYSEVEDE